MILVSKSRKCGEAGEAGEPLSHGLKDQSRLIIVKLVGEIADQKNLCLADLPSLSDIQVAKVSRR